MVATRLGKEKIGAFFTSPLKRCWQTAQEAQKKGRGPIMMTSLLRDVDFGKFAGLTLAQLAKKYGSAMSVWATHPYRFTFPNGESLKAVLKRVRELKEYFESFPFEQVAVFSHHAVLKLMMIELMKLPPSAFHKIHFSLAATAILERKGDRFSLAYFHQGDRRFQEMVATHG